MCKEKCKDNIIYSLIFDISMYYQWVPEITHHCQKTPFLLVGTQIDLRDDAATIEKLAKNKQKAISGEQGEKLAKELKAVKYVECSALTQVSYTGSCFFFLFSYILVSDLVICYNKKCACKYSC